MQSTIPHLGQVSTNILPSTTRFGKHVPANVVSEICFAHKLQPLESLVLGYLLGKRRNGYTTVAVKQYEMAEKFTCCLRTVHRCIARIEAAGLIVKIYKRDAKGRIEGLMYDLSPVLHIAFAPARKISIKAARIPGYIYVIKSDIGFYKIGKAKNPPVRSGDIGLELPFTIELIHTIQADDYSKAEKILHHHFSNKHVNGEWFRLNENDVEMLCAIKTMEVVK